MDEVDVEPIDLGDEVRQRLQLRLALAPIVFRSPVLDEFLHRARVARLVLGLPPRGRPDPPRSCVGHQFALGPARGGDAPAKFGDLLLREADGEGADGASPAAARSVPGSMLIAPAAAVAARSSRRVGDSDIADMISSCVVPMQSMRHTDRPSAEQNLLHDGIADTFVLVVKQARPSLKGHPRTRVGAQSTPSE